MVLDVFYSHFQELANKATALVKVVYQELPAVISIQDAIKANSFYSVNNVINGDVEKAFLIADHVLEGELHMGGQEHFYLEVCDTFIT